MKISHGIYLDHNATTPLDPCVAEAMRAVADIDLNPASQHAFGRAARRRLEAARDTILELLGGRTDGTHEDRLIFTSGGTEANNLALRGLAGRPRDRVIISRIEHPSVLESARHLADAGFDVVHLPVTSSGEIELDCLEQLLRTPTRLVSIMLANHETGVLQPVRSAGKLCRRYGALLHTDAVQLVGKLPVNFRDLDVDALSFAPHKFSGPRGIGGLIVRGGLKVDQILYGGTQQFGLRPGTESVSLAVGAEAALRLYSEAAVSRTATFRDRRDLLESLLAKTVEGCVFLGAEAPRAPQTTCVAFPGVDRQALLIALDRRGIACSAGATCTSGSSPVSPVLVAMGVPQALLQGAIRLSVGTTTSQADIHTATAAIGRAIADMAART